MTLMVWSGCWRFWGWRSFTSWSKNGFLAWGGLICRQWLTPFCQTMGIPFLINWETFPAWSFMGPFHLAIGNSGELSGTSRQNWKYAGEPKTSGDVAWKSLGAGHSLDEGESDRSSTCISRKRHFMTHNSGIRDSEKTNELGNWSQNYVLLKSPACEHANYSFPQKFLKPPTSKIEIYAFYIIMITN